MLYLGIEIEHRNGISGGIGIIAVKKRMTHISYTLANLVQTPTYKATNEHQCTTQNTEQHDTVLTLGA